MSEQLNEDVLRKMIRMIIMEEILDELDELEENSTSAATPGYQTPNAFKGSSDNKIDEPLIVKKRLGDTPHV